MLYEIFVDINNAYDALDQGQSLEILEGYGVEPQVCRLLTLYWDPKTMAVRESGYCGDRFQGSCCVTQGDPSPPIIFNVFVDAICTPLFWAGGGE